MIIGFFRLDLTGRSAIQRRHIIELAYKPIQFCQVTFNNSPLIGSQGHGLQIMSDGRFTFQSLRSGTGFGNIKIAANTRHSMRATAPERI
ncbi:hypothetical protein BV360_05519 [Pseudomonas syringae pv. actinidiae]|nr:hypothetical protein BV340_04084 [Pseudomonas syringae pv. actinidiae]OSN23284.1 hypothetical protein BV341_04152 [Pseudomonas syringae pv. actinidiae]OSN32223.1 hypothetical protein BV342_04214 [Pseudomonas syringae pv. actinidiae]OSN57925.1 hypothetical protein BV347_04213 [Pseudomonas syringae pv. actinidiae]OSN63421.1 hypothetical protein BV350_05509 [Pseudomonas syringae pv. actinidiae]